MRMIVHRSPIGSALPFVLSEVCTHLRVEPDEDDYGAPIEIIAQAAAADLEEFAQIALLNQIIRVNIFNPNPLQSGFLLPIGPVELNHTPTVTFDGGAFTGFAFVGGDRPYINWKSEYFDNLPSRITIEYQAGFGEAATDIPADLVQALMDQAAMHYDARGVTDARQNMTSQHMARVGARYRGVRV